MRHTPRFLAFVAAFLAVSGLVLFDPYAPHAAALGACPPGAPPNSSLCSPAGAAVIAEFAAVNGSTASTATAVTATSASTVGGVSLGTTLGNTAGAALSLGGVYGLNAFFGNDVNLFDLGAQPPSSTDGWVWDPTSTHQTGTVTSTAYGVANGTGTFNITYPTWGSGVSVSAVMLCTTGNAATEQTVYSYPTVAYSYTCPSGGSVVSYALNARREGAGSVGGVSQNFRIIGSWYPQGHPSRPASESPAEVLGRLLLDVQCKGVGGLVTDVAVSSLATVAAGFGITMPDAICPPGTVATGFDVGFQPNGGSRVDLGGKTGPGWVQSFPTEHPNCLPGSGTNCYLELWKVNPDGSKTSCGPAAVYCLDWYRETNQGTQEGRYECRYGGTVLPLYRCSPFREPGTVKPNADSTTGQEPATAPIPAGQPAPGPTTVPLEPPYKAPAPSPDPGGTPTTDPDAPVPPPPGDGPTDDPPPPTAERPSECWPSGWGAFNPLSWVYMPVKCALSWAFVPSDAFITSYRADVGAAFDATALGDLRDVVEGFEAVTFPGGGGAAAPLGFAGTGLVGASSLGSCGVLYEVPIAAFQGHTMTLDTCEPPWSSAGPLRTLVGLAFIVGTGVACISMVTRALGLRSFVLMAARTEAKS